MGDGNSDELTTLLTDAEEYSQNLAPCLPPGDISLSSQLHTPMAVGTMGSLTDQLPHAGADGGALAQLRDAFRRAFSLVEEHPARQWAREFLFDRSPDAAAQVLTNTAALPHAVSAEFIDTLFEADGKSNGLFDTFSKLDELYVPAFAVGDITVGVSVHRSVEPKCSPCDPSESSRMTASDDSRSFRSIDLCDVEPPKFALGRYVRDSRTDRVLVVRHDQNSALGTPAETTVSFMHSSSSTKNERVRIICDGALFARGRYLESARSCVTSNESRFCPVCGAGPSWRCGCTPRAVVPANSPNFSRDVLAMSAYPGEYLGSATGVAAVPSNVPGKREYVRTSLVSNLRLYGFSRPVPRHRKLESSFLSFAVQLSLSERSPARAVMPPPDADTEVLPASYVRSESDRLPATSEIGVLVLDACDDSSIGICDYSNAARDGSVDQLTGDGRMATSSPDVNVTEFSFGSGECFTSNQTPLRELLIPPSDPEGVIAEHRDFAALADIAQPPTTGHEESSWGLITPSPGATTASGDAAIHELILRDARRRQQNREAAARANTRRKERNDRLKRELAEEGRRAEQLRVEETRLRAENLEMRRRLASGLQQQRGAGAGAT